MAGGVKRGSCPGLRFGAWSMAVAAGVVSIRLTMTIWRRPTSSCHWKAESPLSLPSAA